MTNMDNSIQKKQLTTLALIGLVILVLFATGFVWLYYYVGVLGNGGVDVFLAFAPYFIFPYLVVISVYVGFFAARFAKGSWKHAWLWTRILPCSWISISPPPFSLSIYARSWG